MSQEKYITSIKEKVQKKIDKLRNEANEAYLSWADTGHQRYMNKMEKLETEADELEAFIKPELEVRIERRKANEEEAKKEELKLLLKNMCSAIDMLEEDFPDCSATRRLGNLRDKFKFEYMSK